MAGCLRKCNHLAALLFTVGPLTRAGFANPACPTNSCEWLLNQTKVQPLKIKHVSFKRDDFSKRGKKNTFPIIHNTQEALLNL